MNKAYLLCGQFRSGIYLAVLCIKMDYVAFEIAFATQTIT